MTAAEDRACVVLLFCATFGVGSMSFGAIFAAAGPLLASLSIYFLSACNLHARCACVWPLSLLLIVVSAPRVAHSTCVCLWLCTDSVAVSKAMTVAPVSVRTFSDLGYFAFGDTGRRVVLVSEAGVCFLSPIAFLILGGTTLLPFVFDSTPWAADWRATEWIVIMALGVLPIVLIPTLKGAAPLCLLGCVAAIVADITCVAYSLDSIKFSPRETQLEVAHVGQTFGTIMFAMGTAIIIPPIQRQHTDPSRVANLVSLTLLVITSIYLLLGIVTYYQFGCTAPATLLDQLPPSLYRQLAAGLMLVHVVIAFPVLLTPTLFDIERHVLGKDSDIEVLQQSLALKHARERSGGGSGSDGKPILRSSAVPSLASLDTDAFAYGSSHGDGAYTPYVPQHSPTSVADSSAAAAYPVFHDADVAFTMRDRICSSLIRTATVAVQTLLAVMLQSSFMDLLSLIGATAITLSCMVMPCLCYLKVHPITTANFLGQCDKALCYTIIVVSSALGVYCTLVAAGNIHRNVSKYHLFQPANATALSAGDAVDQYPFCHVGERN